MDKIIIKENDRFLGFVIEDNTVQTVGALLTLKECEDWLEDCIARRAWEDGSEAPDMYDNMN
jgi:hypothetical protein